MVSEKRKRQRGGKIQKWEDDLQNLWRRVTRNSEKPKKLGEVYADRQRE